jgi:hypothetical protein
MDFRRFDCNNVLYICLAVLSVIWPRQLFAESEPNNDSATASVLGVNASSSGTLSETDVVDWWVITIPSDGKLYVETNSDASLEIDDYMYDMAVGHFESLASYDVGWGTKESSHRNDLKAGTYYIKASRYSGSGAYTITSQFTPSALANDAEPNDSAAIASPLRLDSSSTGHLGYFSAGVSDQADWWKVTVPSDGKLTVSTVSDSTLEIDLFLIDKNDSTQIASYDIEWGVNESTHFNNLTPGTYYIKCKCYSGYGSYRITNAFVPARLPGDTVANDSVPIAAALGLNKSATGHLGFYNSGVIDLVDWWKVTVPSDGKLTVNTVSDSTLEIDLYIIDKNGSTQIASYDVGWGVNEAVHFNNLTPGTYYFKCKCYSGYGSYTIGNAFSPASLANDAEPNDSIPIAKPLAVGMQGTGHIGFYDSGIIDSWDFYTVAIPANWDTLFVRTVSDSTAEIDLRLYNSQAVQIGSSGSWGIRELLVQPAVSAGSYTIGVKGYSGYGSYTILVSSTRPDTGNLPTDVRKVKPAATVSLTPQFMLSQNFPNPAQGKASIRYGVKNDGPARLVLYDISGRMIRSIFSGYAHAGFYTATINAETLAKGIYYYCLQSGASVCTMKMIIK